MTPHLLPDEREMEPPVPGPWVEVEAWCERAIANRALLLSRLAALRAEVEMLRGVYRDREHAVIRSMALEEAAQACEAEGAEWAEDGDVRGVEACNACAARVRGLGKAKVE